MKRRIVIGIACRLSRGGRGKSRRAWNSASDHMAHALIEGDWKLVMAMTDKPAALYNLAADLAEKKNLFDDPGQTS